MGSARAVLCLCGMHIINRLSKWTVVLGALASASAFACGGGPSLGSSEGGLGFVLMLVIGAVYLWPVWLGAGVVALIALAAKVAAEPRPIAPTPRRPAR